MRARRGATMPLVCVMLAAIIGAAALAVDIGRLYYSGAEVQTAADAAALAAARTQQYDPTAGMTAVTASAQAVAALNKSGGQPITVQSSDVLAVTYNPSTRAIGPSSWSQDAAAFTVTAQATVPSIFQGGSHTVRRSATAWIANVNGANCVRPIAINYTRFYESGFTWDTRYSGTNTYAPDFSLWDIGSTHKSSLPGRTFIVLPPGAKESEWRDTTKHKPTSSQAPSGYTGAFNTHGNWEPIENAGSAMWGFTLGLQIPEGHGRCPYAAAAVGDIKPPIYVRNATDSTNLLAATNDGMAILCPRNGNTNLAYCMNADGKVGVKTRIMLTDSVTVNGNWMHKVREVGRARLMCYFRSTNDVCVQTPIDEIDAKGTWCFYSSTTGTRCAGPFSGYPVGTIIMMLDTPGSMDLAPDVVLGTKPGLTQRVLLAK